MTIHVSKSVTAHEGSNIIVTWFHGIVYTEKRNYETGETGGKSMGEILEEFISGFCRTSNETRTIWEEAKSRERKG